MHTADRGLPRPTSLAFSTRDRSLLIGQPRRGRLLVGRIGLQEQRRRSIRLPATAHPSTLSFDPAPRRLVAADSRGLLVAVAGRWRRLRAVGHGLREPRGVTFDSRRRTWFVLDGRTNAIVRVPARGRPTRISLRGLGRARARAIAFNPVDRLVYVLVPGRQLLVAVDRSGKVRRALNVAALHLGDPRAMTFAPSGDPTDRPGTVHLYVLDRGTGSSSGRVVEAAQDVSTTSETAELARATLVQLIHTSAYSPPSPDPAGITYFPSADRLLISDSEVDEMTIYQGRNLFTGTRTGSGLGTGTTLTFSKEPTGLGINPNDGTLFVSDDDGDRISVVRPGPDGVHGTSDDSWTRFTTSTFGSTDPEGVEYDPASGHLFVCDGLGLEVYDVNPVNGAFGDGNDVVTSFDVGRYGARDCEGLGIDQQRSTLLAVDPSGKKIFELTGSGQHVRTIDLSTIPTSNRNFAGVALAPTSDPGDDPSAMSYWVVDRQVDNGADPNENDGKLYELSVSATPPPPPPDPGGGIPIRLGVDDADETQDGKVRRSNGDLELGSDHGNPTTVGLRFTGLPVPAGATVTSAYVQFKTDEKGRAATSLRIEAQQSGDAQPFSSTAFNLSSRPRTAASVNWAPPQWLVTGTAGADQRTPDISSVVQEVVGRSDWSQGKSLVILITGSGRRTAESFEGGAPPVLHIQYAGP